MREGEQRVGAGRGEWRSPLAVAIGHLWLLSPCRWLVQTEMGQACKTLARFQRLSVKRSVQNTLFVFNILR